MCPSLPGIVLDYACYPGVIFYSISFHTQKYLDNKWYGYCMYDAL